MIDSHTHLDQSERPVGEVVADAQQAGVRRLLTIGLDAESSLREAANSERFEDVFFAAGLHPNSASDSAPDEIARIAEIARHERCRAIGETGLDYYRDHATSEDQERIFRAQIELAHQLSKPLVIHARAADEPVLEILDQDAVGLQVIIHCFSLTEHVETCIERDYYCSFACNVTYPKADDLRAAAAQIPDDRILVETDAPYLAPQSMRGKKNESANVTFAAETVAEARGVTYGELERQVEENAARLFGW